MTVVVGMADKGNVWIGADSLSSRGYTVFETRDAKVFRRGEVIAGTCGPRNVSQTMRFAPDFPEVGRLRSERYVETKLVPWLRAALKKADSLTVKDQVATTDSQMILGVRGTVFIVEQDLGWVVTKSGYITTGCGWQYALGSLSETAGLPPEQRVRRAVRAACLHDAHCGGPVRIVSSLKQKR